MQHKHPHKTQGNPQSWAHHIMAAISKHSLVGIWSRPWQERQGVCEGRHLEDAAAEALDGGRGEDGVRRARVHLARALRVQHLGRVRDCACAGPGAANLLQSSGE